jgi:hypothetical protein
VNEYLNKFTQLSRYTPGDVNTDEKKQDAFMNGLNDEIQFQLLNTDYEDFQRMVDKAINVENKLKEMERHGKQKMSFQGQSLGGNTRPRLQAWPLLQSTADDLPTDVGTTSSVSNAATQPPDAAAEFSDATLLVASTSA